MAHTATLTISDLIYIKFGTMSASQRKHETHNTKHCASLHLWHKINVKLQSIPFDSHRIWNNLLFAWCYQVSVDLDQMIKNETDEMAFHIRFSCFGDLHTFCATQRRENKQKGGIVKELCVDVKMWKCFYQHFNLIESTATTAKTKLQAESAIAYEQSNTASGFSAARTHIKRALSARLMLYTAINLLAISHR